MGADTVQKFRRVDETVVIEFDDPEHDSGRNRVSFVVSVHSDGSPGAVRLNGNGTQGSVFVDADALIRIGAYLKSMKEAA